MGRPVTKAEARAFRARWQAVNAAEVEELRGTPVEEKMAQLAALMASVDASGWAEALEAEDTKVRERWSRLRRALHG